MHFDFKTFIKFAYFSIRKPKEIPSDFTLKRFFFLISFFTIFPLVQIFNRICFLLDDFLFPDYRKIPIKQPIFIIGNPRSGTTFLHRLMAKDHEKFYFFKTWELFFPAIIQKKFLSKLGTVDRILGGAFSSAITRIESSLFNKFNKIHRIGLFLPEEDDKLNMHIFSSLDLLWFFPFKEIDRLNHFDDALTDQERHRIMTFYKTCLQRQAYFAGNKGYLLSKNPLFCAKLESLYEYFPNCRIIYLVRNPLQVVPSLVSMAHEIWASTINIRPGYPMQQQVYDTVRHFYNYPLTQLKQKPVDSYMFVKYEDLTSQPSRVVMAIYQHLGITPSESLVAALEVEDEKAKCYRSEHVYSLNSLHITRDEIYGDLEQVFIQFGYGKDDQ